MYIKKVRIHNFRSLEDVEFDVENYTLLIGENNAGKSNILAALRILYNDLKFEYERDFPKFSDLGDNESWIEVTYELTSNEYNLLPEKYKLENNLLKVRKYFYKPNGHNQENLYAYEKDGTISQASFFGAKNVGTSKLGHLIFIPDVTTSEETFKVSGKSPFREILDYVISDLLENSKAYKSLAREFETFSETLRSEESQMAINEIINSINESLKIWDLSFGLSILPLDKDTIVKNLISHYLHDESLSDKIEVKNFGQGLQRYLIFTLIKLASEYKKKQSIREIENNTMNNEFRPNLTLIVFEEPEAYLHPTQQEVFNIYLRKLAEDENVQVLLTTHSPAFVSGNISNLTGICKLSKDNGKTRAFQLSSDDIKKLWEDNKELLDYLKRYIESSDCSEEVRKSIEEKFFSKNKIEDLETLLEKEALRLLLYIDKERASMFFARHVILCEGATEKAFLDYLLNTEWVDIKEKGVYVVDCLGKYNINRFINLLSKLGINHSVLFDRDNDEREHKAINTFLLSSSKDLTTLTKGCYAFDKDFEHFLGIKSSNVRKDLKPLNVLHSYLFQKTISKEKIQELRKKLEENGVLPK
ncbi:ATP-dependent nuclease [Fervidobacterium sp.]